MTFCEDARLVELLGSLGMTPDVRPPEANTLGGLMESAPLLGLLLYMNTYETVLFWSLRSLVRTSLDMDATTTLDARVTESQIATLSAQETQRAQLAEACDVVQTAQDTLNSVLVPTLVKPSLLHALRFYVDEATFDESTLACDVEALFSTNHYCVEGAEEERDDEEVALHDDVMSGSTSSSSSSSSSNDSFDGSASCVTGDSKDSRAVSRSSHSPPSLATLDSSPETDEAGQQRRPKLWRQRQCATHIDAPARPHRAEARQRTAQRVAERLRQRRWQRARECALHAPPPLSSAAAFLVSLTKALLQVYLRAQHARPQPTLPVVAISDLAAEEDDVDKDEGEVDNEKRKNEARADRSHTGSSKCAARVAYCTPRVTPQSGLLPLPYLFPPSRTPSRSRYHALAQHPYTMASLFPRGAYARPPNAHTKKLFGPACGGGSAENEEDGLVLNWRSVSSEPDTVHRRHRRWQLSGGVRDPFARAAALQRVQVPSISSGDPVLEDATHSAKKRQRESVEASALPQQQQQLPCTQTARTAAAAGVPGLPHEVQHAILLFLAPRYVGTAACVCRLWRRWVLSPPPNFVSPLPYYAEASRAITRVYLRFFRDEWGEKCLQLPTLTFIHRLHSLRLGAVAATVQAVWDAIEGDAVARQWVWSRGRALRVQHIAAVASASEAGASCLVNFVEPCEVRTGAAITGPADVAVARPVWGCAPVPSSSPCCRSRAPASSSSGSRSNTAWSAQLPVQYLMLYLWHEYPTDAAPRQALALLLDALQHELLFGLLLSPPASSLTDHTNGDVAGSPSEAATVLAVEEVLRQQYLLWVLLQEDASGAGAASRTPAVLYEVWSQWPRVKALWTEMKQVEPFR